MAIPQAKFLSQALHQWLSTCSAEFQAIEAQANNAAYIRRLFNEPKEVALGHLLTCLPLLSPSHTEAKASYMELIPKLLSHSIEKGCHIEESRQLLSYWLIHPALAPSERAQFKLWLSQLEDCSTSSQRSTTESSPDIFTVGSTGPSSTSAAPKSTTSTGLQDVTNTHHNLHKPNVGVPSRWEPVDVSKETAIAMMKNQELNQANANLPSSIIPECARTPRAIVSSSVLGQGDMATLEVQGRSLHRPLQATHSGPPAFISMPVSCGSTGDDSQKLGCSMSLAYPPPPPHATISPPPSSSYLPARTTPSQCVAPYSVANNATQPGQHVCHWLNQNQDFMAIKAERLRQLGAGSMGVDSSGIIGHAPLSPQSSEGSTSSGSDHCREESHLPSINCPPLYHPMQQQNTFLDESSGMRDVPIWLKSLRLHKYSMLFQTLSYEEMLNLSEEWLEQQNVTKGARNKIIISIKKLRSRQTELRVMEKEIMESCHLKQALNDLKLMMNTPIKAYTPDLSVPPPPLPADLTDPDNVNQGTLSQSDVDSLPQGDLPGQITRVLGKLCTQLLISAGRVDDECFSMYFQLLDKCAVHEAFTTEQKKKVYSWKLQMQKVWQPPSQKYSIDRQKKIFALHNTLPIQLLRGAAQRPLRGQQTMVAKPGQPKWSFSGRAPTPVGGPNMPPQVSLTLPLVNNAGLSQAGTMNALYRNNSFNTAFTSRPALLEVKQPVTRTHSAPMRTSQYPVSLLQRGNQELVGSKLLDEGLENVDGLCSSMAKHALGSFGESL